MWSSTFDPGHSDQARGQGWLVSLTLPNNRLAEECSLWGSSSFVLFWLLSWVFRMTLFFGICFILYIFTGLGVFSHYIFGQNILTKKIKFLKMIHWWWPQIPTILQISDLHLSQILINFGPKLKTIRHKILYLPRTTEPGAENCNSWTVVSNHLWSQLFL